MKDTRRNFLKDARGFSIIELLFVMTVILVVFSLAIIGVTKARNDMQMNGAVELLKGYIERATTDARRRHAGGADRSKLVVTGENSFNITVDFAGDGNPETRTITLPSGVRFDYDTANPPTATIDWRGMVAEGAVNFRLLSRQGESVDLHLSNVGDASINGQFSYPALTVTTSSSDIRSTTVVNGNLAPNPNPSPTAYPTPLPVCTGSQIALTTPCRCKPGKDIDDAGKCK